MSGLVVTLSTATSSTRPAVSVGVEKQSDRATKSLLAESQL